MAGYIGSKSSVTQVDGYTEAEADAEFVTKTGDTMTGNLDVTGTVTADGFIKTPYISLGNTGNSYQTVTGSSDGNDLTYRAYQNHIFKNTTGASSSTDGTERMRIDSSGNLLVGTTGNIVTALNPSTLQVKSSSGQNAIKAEVMNESYVCYASKSTYAGHYYFAYMTNSSNGLVGSISCNTSSTSYNTSSDYRLKEDWVSMTGASERVLDLKPVNFAWKVDGSRVDGFLAHEVQEVVPEAATGDKDAMRDEEYEVTPAVYEDVVIPAVLDEEGTEVEAERTEQTLVTEAVMGTRSVPDYQGIDQSKLVPLLTAALQEALTEIASLKTRVEALEA